MTAETLFIVNPISGTGKQKRINAILQKSLDYSRFNPTIVLTERSGHATELSHNAIGKYEYVIAVGGDGTVNEVARGLVGSNTVMGIIPVGSGNGLARHLNIPMNTTQAVKTLNKLLIKPIDTLKINDQVSVNVSGTGFDAHVAHLFAKNGKRGPIPYVKIAASEFMRYKSQAYSLELNGKKIFRNAFLISLANSSQFGNNAYISPEAKIDDGLVDVCIMGDIPKVESSIMATRLMNKTLHKSQHMEYIRTSRVVIDTNHPIVFHIDGDPIVFNDKIEVDVIPASLKIIYNDEIQKPVITSIEKDIAELLENQSVKAKKIISRAKNTLGIKTKTEE